MPEEKRPLKVFLCHAHSDAKAVRALYERLTADGVDAWLDKEKLLPGQNWELGICRAVRKSDVVVVCLSKQFNQAGYRQKEVRIALDEADKQPEDEIFIIPARLEECDVSERLSRWHWVDLFEDDGYEKLMKALETRALHLENILRQVPDVEKGFPRIFWTPTDAVQDQKPYISIDITSKEDRLLKSRCYIKSLSLSGILRDDIKHELVKHTNRVSWSGGSDEEVGIKYIDPSGFGKINLASLDVGDFIRSPLQFEMAKGPQLKDMDGNFLPFGKYILDLGLTCNVGGVELPEIPIKIGFEYVEEHNFYEDNRMKKGKTTRKILRLFEIKPAK